MYSKSKPKGLQQSELDKSSWYCRRRGHVYVKWRRFVNYRHASLHQVTMSISGNACTLHIYMNIAQVYAHRSI